MTLDTFITYLNQGREIEFRLDEHEYFLQPDYESCKLSNEIKYVLYDCANPSMLSTCCCGTIQDILHYNFGKEISLQNNFQHFKWDYVL